MTFRFVKMHGIGNDFVMVNGLEEQLPWDDLKGLAHQVCRRRFGVGADGLIAALPGSGGRLAMRMWNPDGSESEMCGNGVRCFALFVRDLGLAAGPEIEVETGAGLLRLEIIEEGRVRVDMGSARFKRGEIGMLGDPESAFMDEPLIADGHSFRGHAVGMGNPHLVIFTSLAETVDLHRLGPILERHPDFPHRTNVHFVQVEDGGLIQRTWERGAGATLACGTGACASAAAAWRAGLAGSRSTVHLPGGALEIEIFEDGRVAMTGPVAKVYEGLWAGADSL
jgi:diaminopimelate epimerase